MSYIDDNPAYRIDGPEAALKYLQGELEKLATLRSATFLAITVETQQSAYRRLLLIQAGVFGALSALHRCGLVQDDAYARMRDEIATATNPVVQHVGG